MNENFKVKKSIIWKKLRIQLIEVVDWSSIRYDSITNVIAIDFAGKIVWKAEAPKSHFEQYYDMEIDTSNNCLIAITGSGYKHIIDLQNGKVVDFYLTK